MIINSNYSFTITVSVDGYSSKEESIKCLRTSTASDYGKKQMAFVETSMTTDQFVSLALSGHSFSGLYNLQPGQLYKDEYGHEIKAFYSQKNDYRNGAMKIQFKRNEYFKSSQVVYVDVDETRFQSIEDYVSVLTKKPTCVYTTFSDGIEKHKGKGDISRRFRLVYVLDTQLQADYWTAVSYAISDMVRNDTGEDVDCCGTRVAQMMNGSCGKETYTSYTIYSLWDFDFFSYLPSFQQAKTIQEKVENNTSGSEEFLLDDTLVDDMEKLGYDDFMKKYSRLYKYFYRTERQDWIPFGGTVEYQETDENYLQLWFYPEKLEDGEGRRQTIANRAFQLRLINPEADINTILFNLYVFREKYIDNSDGTITIRVLVNRAKLVFEKNDIQKNIQEQAKWIKYCKDNRPRFITRSNIFKQVPQNIINQITKELNHKEISSLYDSGKTVKENLEFMKSSGLDICEKTLYNYLKEKHINFKRPNQRKQKKQAKEGDIEKFKKLYDPVKSARENASFMSSRGLKMSKNKVLRMAKELGLDDKKENSQESIYNGFSGISFEVPVFNFGF